MSPPFASNVRDLLLAYMQCGSLLPLRAELVVPARASGPSDSAVAAVMTVHKPLSREGVVGGNASHPGASRRCNLQIGPVTGGVCQGGGRRGGDNAARIRQGGIHVDVARAKVRWSL
jgi:hypothetical protein